MPAPTVLPTSGLVSGSTTGQIQNWYAVNGAVNELTIVRSSVKTASYTLALSDSGECVEVNTAGASTLTVPNDSAVAFPVGSIVSLCQLGVGQVTITPASGVTLLSSGSLVTRTQYSEVTLRKRAANTWVVSGDVV